MLALRSCLRRLCGRANPAYIEWTVICKQITVVVLLNRSQTLVSMQDLASVPKNR
jgi:hypothetical protein